MTTFRCHKCEVHFSVPPDKELDVEMCPCCSAASLSKHDLTGAAKNH